MSKLVMWNLVTLNGFFEGSKQWDLGWHHLVLDQEFEQFAIDQLRSASRLIFGRKTYEGMAAHWPRAQGNVADLMNGLPKVVFSKTITDPEWVNTRLAGPDTVSEVRTLKEDGAGMSLVIGSGILSKTLMSHDLFDEYRLLLTPVILKEGRALFDPDFQQQNLRLLSTQALTSGGVILRYAPIPRG